MEWLEKGDAPRALLQTHQENGLLREAEQWIWL